MSMIEKENDEIFKRESITSVVNSISEDIMVDNIIQQIDNSLKERTFQSQTDLFEYFANRYRYLVENYSYDSEVLKTVIESFNEVLEKIKTSLENIFKFKITFDEGIEMDNKILLIRSLYEFFILYIHDNCTSLIYNAINKNMDTLLKICKIKNKKDLTYLNIKKIINNDYTPVIYCLDTIISNIDLDCNDDIIDYMTLDDPDMVCNFYTRKIFFDCYYSDIIFEGNLYNILKSKINNDYGLQLEVKNRLINKYKNM